MSADRLTLNNITKIEIGVPLSLFQEERSQYNDVWINPQSDTLFFGVGSRPSMGNAVLITHGELRDLQMAIGTYLEIVEPIGALKLRNKTIRAANEAERELFEKPYSEVNTETLQILLNSLEMTYSIYQDCITNSSDDAEGIAPFYEIMRAIEAIKKELANRG